MNKIITISRQYASGGREIGALLAKEYGIPFYDNELITRAAKESGFAEEAFRAAETKATNSFLYSIAMGMSSYGSRDFGTATLSLDDRIYIAQADIIKKVADEGPCVIVGRCADYVLRERDNVIHIFLNADMDFRVARALKYGDVPVNKVEDGIRKIDKRRANYYNYHSCETWGKAENYHMTINTAVCGIEGTVKIIKAFVDASGDISHVTNEDRT